METGRYKCSELCVRNGPHCPSYIEGVFHFRLECPRFSNHITGNKSAFILVDLPIIKNAKQMSCFGNDMLSTKRVSTSCILYQLFVLLIVF